MSVFHGDFSLFWQRQTDKTDNACLFYMVNEKTRRSSKSTYHGLVTICLFSCNSSDTQRTDATLEN